MTRANQWLLFGGVVSVGAGFLGGMMFSRRAATRDCLVASFGQLYEVDTETYGDGAMMNFLTARADSSELLRAGKWDGWTMLRFGTVALFVKLLHAGQVLPGQRGALYNLRAEHSTARNDLQVQRFLQEMIDLGLVKHGGHWREWSEVLRIPNEAKRT